VPWGYLFIALVCDLSIIKAMQKILSLQEIIVLALGAALAVVGLATYSFAPTAQAATQCDLSAASDQAEEDGNNMYVVGCSGIL